MRRVAKNTIALLLVFTMVITLGLSAYASATDSGEDTQKFVDVKSEQDQTGQTDPVDQSDPAEPGEPGETGEPGEPGEPGQKDEDLEELENLVKEEEILSLLESFDTKSLEEQANILEEVEVIVVDMSRIPLKEVQDIIDEAKELHDSMNELEEQELANLIKAEEILNLLEDFDTKSVEEQETILQEAKVIVAGMTRKPLKEVQEIIDEAKELYRSINDLENVTKEKEIIKLLEDFEIKSIEEQAAILEEVEVIVTGMSREPLEEIQNIINSAIELFELNTDLGELAEDYPYIETPDIPVPFADFRRMQTFGTAGFTDTIAVDKTAKRSPGCRTFEVSLDITGTPQKAPVDVVLVIDRSGSMNQRAGGTNWNPLSRLYYAKQAAVNFAGRVLGPNGIPGSRVSIVSFSGPTTTSGDGNQNQASTDLNLSNNLTTVTNTINGITAVGGTNTQAGFIQGQSVIQGQTSNQNPNSNKVVIMFTDGLPTASNGNRYADTTNINHVHIQSAIAAGKNIYQNNIADVFTIGLTTGMNATEKALADNILTQAQNKGYFPAPDSTDLDDIFDTISQSLGYSATNAKVIDKIGDKFDLVESSLPAGATYNTATREITWNPGTIVDSSQIKYVVRAKSDFPGGWANTNENATLTYKDIFGTDGKTKDFPIPNVNVPTLIKVSLTNATITSGESISLGTGTDPSGENYMSPVTGGDNDGTTFTYEWRKVGDTAIILGGKNPSVSPTEDTEYEVTVTDSNGCKAKATMWVRVTKLTNVTISKVVSGNMGDRNKDFSFKVTLTDGDGNDVNFTMTSTSEITIDGNKATFTLKHDESLDLTAIPVGSKITVTETDNAGYTVSYTVNEGDPVNGAEAEDIEVSGNGTTIVFTNHKDTTVDTGISLDDLPYVIMLILAGFGALGIFIRKRKYRIE